MRIPTTSRTRPCPKQHLSETNKSGSDTAATHRTPFYRELLWFTPNADTQPE